METAQPVITEGPVPKHVQLSRELARRASEDLRPGQAVPSERELMAEFGLSRATVRRAVEGLIADGLLQRVHGKGTFVAEPRVESHLHLASFTQDMRRRGLIPRTVLQGCTEAEPPEEAARALGVEPGRTAWRISRIRLADEQPMAVEIGWYPAEIFPGLQREDLSGSLYELFSGTYGKAIDSAEQTLWGEAADSGLARQLDAPQGTPLLVFRRTSFSAGVPVEHVTSWYRGDRYQIHMNLRKADS